MFISFGIEKLEGKRIKLHTLMYKDKMEKLLLMANNKAHISKVMNFGIATHGQKEEINAIKEQELEARIQPPIETGG